MSYSLIFSKAVILMLFVADKIRQGHFDFVPTKVLSETLNIPRPTTVKILQGLHQNGLVETREGARGGIRLAKKAGDITILDIFYAIERDKPLFRIDFNLNVSGEKPAKGQTRIAQILKDSENTMKQKLKEVTIADLLESL